MCCLQRLTTTALCSFRSRGLHTMCWKSYCCKWYIQLGVDKIGSGVATVNQSLGGGGVHFFVYVWHTPSLF